MDGDELLGAVELVVFILEDCPLFPDHSGILELRLGLPGFQLLLKVIVLHELDQRGPVGLAIFIRCLNFGHYLGRLPAGVAHLVVVEEADAR